jgi:hypothetical protein
MTILIIKILVFLTLTVLASYFYFENYKNYKLSKLIFLGLIILSAVIFGVWDICNTDSSAKKDKEDLTHTLKETSSNLGVKIAKSVSGLRGSVHDEVSNLAKAMRGSHKGPFALLAFDVVPGGNPIFVQKSNEDSLELRYWIANYGTGVALKISSYLQFVRIYNGKVVFLKNAPENLINKSVHIFPKTSVYGGTWFYLPMRKSEIFDSTFICINTRYTDSTGINKCLTDIYIIKNKNTLVEAYNNDYNKIEKCLVKNKILPTICE